jgi:hypothetical protein
MEGNDLIALMTAILLSNLSNLESLDKVPANRKRLIETAVKWSESIYIAVLGEDSMNRVICAIEPATAKASKEG